MKRILLSLFLFCCYGITFADVSLQLEAPKVQLGQTFSLTLRIEGTQTDSVPDLTPLQQDFAIIGTESTMNYSIINGQAHTVNEWRILLKAKQSGILPIPALQIGKEKTAPTHIEITQHAPTVTQPNNATQPEAIQQQDILLLTEVSVDKPYVNQQVIYTVKLYNSRRLIDTNYQPPTVEDALFVPFGDGRRYQIMKNGRVYAVEEQQFALFPQKSGDLKINPPSFNALIYDMTPRQVNVQAQPTRLKVKPTPLQYKGKNWLPAKQVTLSESYDKSTAPLAEGSTLVRTVILQAVAVPAQLLPTLDFGSSNQFSTYPEKPSESNVFKHHDLVGTTTVKVTYLLNKAGKITIPALTLPWFNTTTGKEELSSLPEFTINVTAAAGMTKPSKIPDLSATTQSPQSVKKPRANETKGIIVTAKPQSNIAWWLVGGFALAWLLTLVAWYWQQPRQRSSGQSKGQILKQLQIACLNNRPTQARDALLKWGHLQWPAANLLNLIDLENLVNDPTLKQQINQLSQALYHDASSHKLWQGEALWRSISAFKSSESVKSNKANPLPPIHRL